MSDSLRPHGRQHARPPCPSPTPESTQTLVHWVGDAIQPSYPLLPPSSCFQSFPPSWYFPVSQLFASGGQSIGASALASVLSVTIQSWFPLELTGLILLPVQGTLKSLLQQHSLKASFLWCSDFFMVQLSHSHVTTGKAAALTRQTFVSKEISLLFTYAV